MKLRSLYRVELGRLLRGRLTWLVTGLTALAPLAGYSFFRPTLGDSMSARYLANPLLTGGLVGTILFALLMLINLEQPRRSGITSLIDAVAPPVTMHIVRLLAVWTVAGITSLAVGALYLPYTAWKLDIVFSMSDYWLAVGLFALSGPIMGALAAAAAGQFTGRLDASLLVVLAAFLFSRGQWCSEYFLAQWSVPLVSTLSDAFGSAVVWRTALYSRLTWLFLLGGVWLLSLLCVRQYGKGAWGSFRQHLKRPLFPIAAPVLLACGAFLWQAQPFVDHSPVNWTDYEEPDRMNEALSTQKSEYDLKIDSYLLGTLSGTGTYQIHNSSGKPQELYFELNAGYNVRSITANGEEIPFTDLKNDYIATRELQCTLPAAEDITLVISYGGMPRIWNAQEYLLSGQIISKEGISLASANLAPAVGGCAPVWDEDAAVSLRISLTQSLTPVSTGSVQKLSDNSDGTASWLIENTGTDRLQLYAGDYIMRELSSGSGKPIKFYYSKKYQSRLENGAIDLMEKAIAYCTEQYGPRTFLDDRPFKILQLTAFQFGGLANNGISGMGESYFSDDNLRDGAKGAGSAEILAHEIIHQWWGLGASLYDPEDDYWSDEGITVYTTYRLMCEIMGEAYGKENYVDKWEKTMKNQQASFYNRHPEYLSRLPERYQNDIRASQNSTNWYDGNALMIYRAAQLLGEEKVDEIWSKLYLAEKTGEISEISAADFLEACGLQKGDISRE